MHLDNIIVDDIKVEITDNFKSAMVSIIEENNNVFLTGRAGTGKTTFLKALCKVSSKKKIVLAPTGIAAINAGGQTIHSFFKLPFKPLLTSDKIFQRRPEPNDKTTIYSSFRYSENRINLIENLELLIIDEVSMVRSDILQAIDRILKVYRKKEHLPFGGVQLVIIGDLSQLPPIVKLQEQHILEKEFKSRFFFSSFAYLNASFRFHELTTIRRQHNPLFIEMLNRIRNGKLLEKDIHLLRERSGYPDNKEGYITICTHNSQVDYKNRNELTKLETPIRTFSAIVDGEFKEKDTPADKTLKLKVGAQVMFLRNQKKLGVYNGTIGEISEIVDDRIVVKVNENNHTRTVVVEKVTWDAYEYFYDEKSTSVVSRLIGSFTQYPLKLAWAITVHKSQGSTFNRVIADLGKAFEYGQVYVGLSRCVDIESLYIVEGINRHKLGPHPWVKEFYRRNTFQSLEGLVL